MRQLVVPMGELEARSIGRTGEFARRVIERRTKGVATTPTFVTIEGAPDQLGPDDAQVADERVRRREGEPREELGRKL
jgi:hypothetical protein